MFKDHSGSIAHEDGKEPERKVYVLTGPTDEEIDEAAGISGIGSVMIRSALDPDNLPRIHFNERVLAFLAVPIHRKTRSAGRVRTMPVGVFFSGASMILISAQQVPEIEKIVLEGYEKGVCYDTIFLQVLYRNALLYIHFLRHIDRETERLENSLRKKVTNKEIFQLMDYQRSLTEISTSLRSLEHIMGRIKENRSGFSSTEMLEDTEVAVRQATVMAEIFDSDLDALMDAFGSVLSNNVNQIMKILTALTLIISIPTMVAGFYGMNVRLPMASGTNAFWLICGVSAFLSLITGIYFYYKKML